jgi:hypothetical protein
MIDDRTVYRLLQYFAIPLIGEIRDGRPLAEIDDRLSVHLRKKDRIALFECMAERWFDDEIVAHLRALKRRKRLPQPTHPPATILPFRPDLH